MKRTANGFLYSTEEQARILYAEALMAAWCDDFQRAMTWLCSPEPTVTIPLKEYERLKAADDALRRRREADAKLPRSFTWDQARLYK